MAVSENLKLTLLKAITESNPTFGEVLDASEWLRDKVISHGLCFLRQESAQEALSDLLRDKSI